MATHSSILAGKSHGQRSLAGYSPWGCKRVGHDLATKQQQVTSFKPDYPKDCIFKQGHIHRISVSFEGAEFNS